MEKTKSRILKELRQRDDYLSGQELCQQLGISRTAVWKNIKALQGEGYEIEAVQNRGYRLRKVPDVISAPELESIVNTQWVGKNVHFKYETDSTNLWAKQLAEQGAPAGTVVVAERQTKGRGRRGRTWVSSEGQNIYMTLLLRPEIQPQDAPMVTLLMGLSVAQGVEKATGLCPGIKWPNDVVLDGKKICGILTEMSVQAEYMDYVVVGPGINVNQTDFPQELSDKATSLRLQAGRAFRRVEVAAAVLEAFEKNLEIFLETCDLTGLQEQYNHILLNMNQEVRILDKDSERTGIARGINNRGELLVEYPGGKTEAVFAGEVSVRGLYSYV